jgi:hypothetical protein
MTERRRRLIALAYEGLRPDLEGSGPQRHDPVLTHLATLLAADGGEDAP